MIVVMIGSEAMQTTVAAIARLTHGAASHVLAIGMVNGALISGRRRRLRHTPPAPTNTGPASYLGAAMRGPMYLGTSYTN